MIWYIILFRANHLREKRKESKKKKKKRKVTLENSLLAWIPSSLAISTDPHKQEGSGIKGQTEFYLKACRKEGNILLRLGALEAVEALLGLVSSKGKSQTLRVNTNFVEGISIYVLHQGKGGALKPGWVESSQWVKVTEGKSNNWDPLMRKRKEGSWEFSRASREGWKLPDKNVKNTNKHK